VPDIRPHLATSGPGAVDDLDWSRAAREGLAADERDALAFFADVEGQTAYYMLEVAKLEVARDPELLTFLTMWNYEELFHSRAIHRLLAACGCPGSDDLERKREVRARARVRVRIEETFQTALATIAPDAFIALWMAWGAAQELVTTQGYERIARTGANPVARELCRRIAVQERRHFAWYYAAARERLEGRPAAQWLVRRVFEHLWTPVGSGVKRPDELAEVIATVWPGPALAACLAHIDDRMGKLPGLQGLHACRRWGDTFHRRHAPAAVPA
jgi:rubrerythrin